LAELGAQRLRALGDEFGADYVVTRARPRVALSRVGPITRTLAVYELRPRRSTHSARPSSSPRGDPHDEAQP
jgi:hypothetical protein